MRFAYADPPYLGMCGKVYGHEHHGGGCWDDLDTHRSLIARLLSYDGWALSMGSPHLQAMLPELPQGVRVMAWCKPTAGWLAGVYPAFGWEPVILSPADRSPPTRDRTIMDFIYDRTPFGWGNGFIGAKPPAFTAWILSALNVQDGDTFDDLFYGSGSVTRAVEAWRSQLRVAW